MKSQSSPKAIIPRLLLSYTLGLSVRFFLTDVPSLWGYLALGLLLSSFFFIHFLSSSGKGLLICTLCFVFGTQRILYLNNAPPTVPENGYVIQIVEPPVSKANSFKSVAKVILQKIDSSQWKYANYPLLVYFSKKDTLIPQLGATYLIQNIPNRVENPKNPHQFDYKLYLERKGIFYQQFLQSGQVIPISVPTHFNIQLFFKKYAYLISQIIKENVENMAASAVIQAMITGMRDDIDRELAQIYTNTGAVHILAVSGMHVGIIYMIIIYILDFLFSFLPYQWRKGKIIISILALIAFACFTGLSPSVVRATTMFVIVQCASFFHRSSSSAAALLSTALLLLVISPIWLLDIGFQLSFLAVYGIIRINPLWSNIWNPKNPIIKPIWDISTVGFSAQLITFPLSLFYFHQFPTYFFVSNPIVSVFASLVIILALALILFASLPFVWITSSLSFILNTLVVFLNDANRWIGNLPWAVSENHQIDLFECILLYSCIILFIQFFYNPFYDLFKIGILMLCLFCIYNIYDDVIKSNQEITRIHYIPKSGGLSIIQGRFAVFISNRQGLNKKEIYEYNLKNYFIAQGIRKFEMVDIQDSTNNIIQMKLNGKSVKIDWIANPKYEYPLKNEAIVMISNNSRVSNFPVDVKIVLDESNRSYFLKKMKNIAEMSKSEVIILKDTGSFEI